MATALDLARVEQVKRRPLTDAERRVDVEAINQLLNDAKDELQAAIEREQARLARALARRGHAPRMRLTGPVYRILERLYEEGRRHARDEIARAGARSLVADPLRPRPAQERRHRLRRVEAVLIPLVARIDRRTKHQAVVLSLGEEFRRAIEKALLRIPGARDAASQVVSAAFDSGLAHTFEQADRSGLVTRWAVSAVLDDATCDPCEAGDGEEFDSWEEIQQVLPGGGPRVDCEGGGRCRCRAVVVA